MKKKLLALLVGACLLLSVVAPVNAATGLQQEVAPFLKSLIGQEPIEWSAGGEGTQCPELPSYYVQQCFGVNTLNMGYGNGNTYYIGISATYPSLFTRIDYYEGFLPQVGDIISFESSTSPAYGHVGIVCDVDYPNDQYSFIDQGQAYTEIPCTTVPIKGHQYAQSYTVIGVARPYKTSFCTHTYDDLGQCTKCGSLYPYDADFDSSYAGIYRVIGGATATVRSGPYAACTPWEQSANGTYTVFGRVKNALSNDWYMVSYHGKKAYIHTDSIEKIADAESTLTISPTAMTCTTLLGKACNIGGTITSNYPITNVKGYLDEEKYSDFAPNAKSVNIGDYSNGMLNSFPAQNLPSGTHIIRIIATDGHKTVTKNLYIVVNTATHTHSYTEYVEAAHPHKVYMLCDCGDRYYTGETRKQEGCAECFPAYAHGDLTGDSSINSDDLTALACIVARIDEPTAAQQLAADVTHDGKVDSDDLTKLAQYVAKIIDNFD